MERESQELKLQYRDDYLRYGRQMILDGFGLEGQIKLQCSSVVVVGAGGLGCPALQYLAAAGVGKRWSYHQGKVNDGQRPGQIGIIDHDKVELSNLQRQILHRENMVGVDKTCSAAAAVQQINSRVQINTITEMLNATNALSLLQPYDIILDCTDNAPTRYLLSDAAVRLGKPLVSGAAQRYEGQLCVYNLGKDGPCYRCIFPNPPAAETTASCEEIGVLGIVTGIIGNMQALETIKLITGLHDGTATLLLFSAISTPAFRSVKLRARKSTCPACRQGQELSIIEQTDYVTFCGGARPNWIARGLIEGGAGERIKVQDLKQELDSQTQHVLVDVRSKTEFGICRLPGSQCIPLPVLLANPASHIPTASTTTRIFVICRLGNDSQIAAQALREVDPSINIRDVIGGLQAWSRNIDSEFPIY